MSNYRKKYFKSLFCFLGIYLLVFSGLAVGMKPPEEDKSPDLQMATFDIDVTPPIGYEMAYDTVIKTWDLGLRARGVVLIGSGQPIVLLSVDWIGIGNQCHDVLKRTIAEAAGTIPRRVAVHTVHQHDAPRCDTASHLESEYVQSVFSRLDFAVQHSLENTQPITHVGHGKAEVSKVASNRRILSSDRDTVRAMRYTSCGDSALRAEPEGVIDPMVSLVSFWNEDEPLAVLSYYATHPQSYYRTGIPNPDFPGVARFLRQLAVPDALHIHFTGAGGNIGAGKYNDGSHENRGILAKRLADGMKRAWESTELRPVSASSVAWDVKPVALPANTAKDNAYTDRYWSGEKIDLQCLTLGGVRILHLPGELCIEYQLAAKAMRPELFVAVAAYGDYGPSYIPPAVAFERGGYEAGAAGVTPEAEAVLMEAIRKLLNAEL